MASLTRAGCGEWGLRSPKLRRIKRKEGGEELKTVNISNLLEFSYKGKQRSGAVAGS